MKLSLKQKRYLGIGIAALGFLLVMIFHMRQLRVLGMGLIVLGMGLMMLLVRCPHCHGDIYSLKGDECPYCGEKIDWDAK